MAMKILGEDPDLVSALNVPLKNYLLQEKRSTVWSKIS
jgi:hypothetical protein